MPKLKELDETEIGRIVASLGLHHFQGCISRDRLPQRLPSKGFWIINLQAKHEFDQEGSHWVFLGVNGDCAYYFDSFGQPIPDDIHYLIRHKHVCQNHNIFQALNSDSCGYYSLYVANELFGYGRSFYSIIEDFNKHDARGENEQLLHKYFDRM
jgi:hypothetical protein